MMTDEPTNILIVDDLPEKLLVYRTILAELNQNLITAGSGEDALRAVLLNDFAVILLDVNMPGMSGLEAAALIRRRKRSAHTPIIFLTAFADEVRAAEGYEQGAVDYISTPVVPAILRAKVRVFADLFRMTQQVRRQAEERIALAQERSKREAAEEANRRLAFLTNAGAVLGGSLDQEVTARDAVRLSLSYLADSAALVTFPGENREPHVLGGRVEEGQAVIETPGGRGLLSAETWEAVNRAAAGNTQSGDSEGVLAVPLHARGGVLGVLWLSRVPSGRTFPAADVAVAQTLASRAAIALENARLYHELQQADRQKNEFLSMLAHELRNPLAPIRNANEMLHQDGADPARVRWAHGVIDRQLTHLVRLVDDLLDVSRLTLGKIRLTADTVELETVITQAVEAVRPLLDKFRHNLEVRLPEQPVRLHGDPARLIQVFANLLNNAAKYTDPGGRISLTAAVHTGVISRPDDRAANHSRSNGPAVPGFVEVRLRDTGVGIAPDLLPTVFDLFTQANRSLDRSQGGLGIGLTLVRKLVEMHGGTVEAHSEGLDRGSEFVIRLPLARERTVGDPAPGRVVEAQPQDRALRVVLVDDNVDGVESLADLIALLGHEVRIAHDGPTGIRLTHEFNPDLVLLDIGLPGMDGYEVARRLRGEIGTRAVLIAVSGYGRDEDRALSLEAGCAQHLVKPVEFRTLQSVFASLPAARRA
jgi:signal transduction histidine kinase/DNA-binding response OmpR family regulator